jgi:hypothetical protein
MACIAAVQAAFYEATVLLSIQSQVVLQAASG